MKSFHGLVYSARAIAVRECVEIWLMLLSTLMGHNTGDKLQGSSMLGLVSFIPLLGGAPLPSQLTNGAELRHA